MATRLNPYLNFPGTARDAMSFYESVFGGTLSVMEHQPGNNINVSLSGDDADELRRYWQALSVDGSVVLPLERQMWGDEFGSCIDRFGIHWMVNIAAS